MYTCCPECGTTFRLGAEDLRRARGKVRCGECATVFNALEYLAEEPAVAVAADELAGADALWSGDAANDSQSMLADDALPFTAADSFTYDLSEEDDDDSEIFSYDFSADPDGDDADADDDDPSAGILVTESDDGTVTDYLGHESAGNSRTSAATLDFAGPANELWPETDNDDSLAEPYLAEADLTDEQPSAAAQPDFRSAAADRASGRSDYPHPSVAATPEQADPASMTAQLEQAFVTDDFDEPVDFVVPVGPETNPELPMLAADEIDDSLDEDGEDAGEDEIEYILDADDEEDDSPAETEISSGRFQPDSASYFDNNLDDFDDSVWERIPGVGSSDDLRFTPHSSDNASAADEFADTATAATPDNEADDYSDDDPEIDDVADADDATTPKVTQAALEEADEADAEATNGASFRDEFEPIHATHSDTLEFNAPEDTWSSIFAAKSAAAGTSSAADTTTAAASEWADELDTDSEDDAWTTAGRSYSDNIDTTGTADAPDEYPEIAADKDPDEDSDEAAEIWTGTLADWQQRPASQDAAKNSAADDADDGSRDDSVAPTDADAPKDHRAAYLTGVFSEEEYDVQHIILADESDTAGLTQSFELPAEAEQEPPPWQPEQFAAPAQGKARTGFWFLAGIFMLVALALQLIHYNRDALAASQAWGESVRGVYGMLGAELFPAWSTDSYEIRGSEAVAGESGPNVMDIRAQIAFVGDEPAGLPQLRVVLRDRWSNPVAAKLFGPGEYAGAANLPADGIMRPNDTLAAHVSIIDPGAGAQGFELELCIPRREAGADCTGNPLN